MSDPQPKKEVQPRQDAQPAKDIRTVKIQRYDSGKDKKPYMQSYEVDCNAFTGVMVLDLMLYIKDYMDPTLSARYSCREGVCGSDGVNINGKNGLMCKTKLRTLPKTITLMPLPGLPIIRDLIVDMNQFYDQYKKIKPYLINDEQPPAKEHKQSIEDRAKLDGLYECILCACCSTSCPSFWWNPDKFVGPAGLLQAYRFLADTRDTGTAQRLADLQDPFSVFRCRGIMNCVNVCPKGLNPTKAIGHIRKMLLTEQT